MSPYCHKVQYYETDKMGITHHSNYIRWMEEARVSMLSAYGWGYEQMEAAGIFSPVTGIECKYKAPTTFADEVEICADVAEYKGVHLVVSYTMRRLSDGKVVLEGLSRHCFVDADGKFIRLANQHPQLDELLRRLSQQER